VAKQVLAFRGRIRAQMTETRLDLGRLLAFNTKHPDHVPPLFTPAQVADVQALNGTLSLLLLQERPR
jgi:hypothetical protein